MDKKTHIFIIRFLAPDGKEYDYTFTHDDYDGNKIKELFYKEHSSECQIITLTEIPTV